MKLRIRLRTLLFGVAAIASACGWYAAHAYQRQREVAAIQRMQACGSSVGVRYLFEETNTKYLYGSDINIELIDRTPSLLRSVTDLFGMEGFHRVNSLVIRSEVDAEIIKSFDTFQQLTSMSFYPGEFDVGSVESLGALVQYAKEHPGVTIILPERFFDNLTPDERQYFKAWN